MVAQDPLMRVPGRRGRWTDLNEVRSRPLAGPDEWDTDLLRFCLRHGFGYLPIPALIYHARPRPGPRHQPRPSPPATRTLPGDADPTILRPGRRCPRTRPSR